VNSSCLASTKIPESRKGISRLREQAICVESERLYYKCLNVLHFAAKTDRKMCVVLQHILARGPLRAPVASPSLWLFQGIEPVPEPSDRIAGQPLAGLGDVPLHLHRTMDQRAYRRPLKPTRKGAFGAPLHPIDLAGVPTPKTPDHVMETTSSRPWKGAFALPLPWTHPIEQGRVTPLASPTNRPPFERHHQPRHTMASHPKTPYEPCG